MDLFTAGVDTHCIRPLTSLGNGVVVEELRRFTTRLAPFDRIILAQRMPFEFVVGEDPSQVGMTPERYTKQVVNLAFVPVGRSSASSGSRRRATAAGS